MIKKYKDIVIIAIVIATVITAVIIKNSQKNTYQLTTAEMLKLVHENKQLISPIEAEKIIADNDNSYLFIDLRKPELYNTCKINNAINIPIQELLDEKWINIFNNNKKKVLYCNTVIKANEAWMLLTQLGYKDIFILEGGITYWKQNIMNKTTSADGNYADEKLKKIM